MQALKLIKTQKRFSLKISSTLTIQADEGTKKLMRKETLVLPILALVLASKLSQTIKSNTLNACIANL